MEETTVARPVSARARVAVKGEGDELPGLPRWGVVGARCPGSGLASAWVTRDVVYVLSQGRGPGCALAMRWTSSDLAMCSNRGSIRSSPRRHRTLGA